MKRDLTEKQIEVLRLMAAGYKSTEVADELCISQYVVKDRLTAARWKLGATTTLHAALIAQQRGIL